MDAHTALVDELRWQKFPVLDDGFVCLVDVMGNDGSVVQAARVSYGEGTRKVSDDRTLIRYLLRHRHTLRNGRDQISHPRADGLLAAVDPASHGECERVQHPLFDRHRGRTDDAAGPMAFAGDDEPSGERGHAVAGTG